MTLKLYNNVSKNEMVITGLTDTSASRFSYSFAITLPSGCPDGEYSYTLLNGNTILATGLAQIGDYTRENKEYKNENKNGYKQYNG